MGQGGNANLMDFHEVHTDTVVLKVHHSDLYRIGCRQAEYQKLETKSHKPLVFFHRF